MKRQRIVLCGLLCILLASAASLWATNPPPELPPPEIGSGNSGSARPLRIVAPKIDAEAAGKEAMKLFDTNKDGKISGKELDKCPGLKAAIDNIDPSGKEEITAEKITARIKRWLDSKLGRMSLGCRVMHNGEPLEGAEVRFVPEKFLGKHLKIAKGKTDENGMAMISIPSRTVNGMRSRPAWPPASTASRSPRKARRFPPNTTRRRSSARKSPSTAREFRRASSTI